MPLRIVQLGTPRTPGEGLRIGTVRRPPRGVPKAEFASRDYYDCWYPELSPSADTMALGQAAQKSGDLKAWQQFNKAFRKEMAEAGADRTLQLLAALSQQASFAIGCYCDDETRCHRSILRALLADKGAAIAAD
ncbi:MULTISPECIES: DUF488 domain-containing protein [Comamonas]|uniref:DUF488 domain-containing protein n=1 Tax=Comamonas terrigena TaxID=32013 RepID=A0A2A7UVY4_COMTR|nr:MULTISPECIES: DUF488 family protein [Comamonas]MBD9530765.1 DUF488 family protein [Comamonas sp. CMM01]MBV7417819.1 DUF488 family protein [Comamonas sp. CMM03]PEH89351.1 DUF488 domain-containing protein [Comamonas terrigena]SUY71902.1 Uncharacterized conserved protein [Comamonas terrigena]BBL24497.1 hypothetical protein CT3_19520 [Comamonas terrigena NBRC 13299]